jgi:AGZA family xanthine/uracil permease-like MFS transporter
MSTPQSNATAGKGLAERLFKLTQHGTTVRTETIAGLTTFPIHPVLALSG